MMKKKIKKFVFVFYIVKYAGFYFYVSLFAHDIENPLPELTGNIKMIVPVRSELANKTYNFIFSTGAMRTCSIDNTSVASASQNNNVSNPEKRFNMNDNNPTNSRNIFLEKLWNTIKDRFLRIQLFPSI